MTEVRLAVQRTSEYQDGGASWRSERRIRARMGRPPRDQHIPDAEVHWPADRSLPGAGQVSVVEVELSRKPFARIVEIMTETLTRTGGYGCPSVNHGGARAAAPVRAQGLRLLIHLGPHRPQSQGTACHPAVGARGGLRPSRVHDAPERAEARLVTMTDPSFSSRDQRTRRASGQLGGLPGPARQRLARCRLHAEGDSAGARRRRGPGPCPDRPARRLRHHRATRDRAVSR